MSKDNGQATRHDRLEQRSGMPAEQLERRSAQFQRALNRKGMPMVWGVGKGPVNLPPRVDTPD
jgi:hypothetical protein